MAEKIILVHLNSGLTTFKSTKVIGHVYTVHQNNRSVFSSTSLCTIKNYPTPMWLLEQELENSELPSERHVTTLACLRMTHLQCCMEEAAVSATSGVLRSLFAMILTCCKLSNSCQMWEQQKEPLSEDVLHQCHTVAEHPDMPYIENVFNEALLELQNKVEMMGYSSLDVYSLPKPVVEDGNCLAREVLREKSYDVDALQHQVEETVPNLTED